MRNVMIAKIDKQTITAGKVISYTPWKRRNGEAQHHAKSVIVQRVSTDDVDV